MRIKIKPKLHALNMRVKKTFHIIPHFDKKQNEIVWLEREYLIQMLSSQITFDKGRIYFWIDLSKTTKDVYDTYLRIISKNGAEGQISVNKFLSGKLDGIHDDMIIKDPKYVYRHGPEKPKPHLTDIRK